MIMVQSGKKKQTVEELLNSAIAYWVCPITGRQIPATNNVAIEEHKQKLIQQEREKEITRQRDLALNALYKEFKNIVSLKDFNEYIRNVISLKEPTFPQEKMPEFKVETIEFSTKNFLLNSDTVPIRIIGMQPEIRKMFKQNLQKNINAKHMSEEFYMLKKIANPLAQAVDSFLTKAGKNKIVTVGIEEKELLAQHEKYPELLKKLQTIKNGLHELRLQHAIVDQEMASIREEVLNPKTFVDKPIKTATTKMKR